MESKIVLEQQVKDYMRAKDYGKAVKLLEKYEHISFDSALKIVECYYNIGNFERAHKVLKQIINDEEINFGQAADAALWVRKLSKRDSGSPRKKTRVAVLGTFTTNQIIPILYLFAWARNMHLDIYEAPYNQIQQEILNPESGLYNFKPEFIIIATIHKDIAISPFPSDINAAVKDEIFRWRAIWDRCCEAFSCRIIQHNFDIPLTSAFGHLEPRIKGSYINIINRLNQEMFLQCPRDVTILDFDMIASSYGKMRWYNPKYWYLSKNPFDLNAIPLLVKHYVAIVAAGMGMSKKCIIVDLDNTIWGGVVGEDGMQNICLGGNGSGEAFIDFQRYLISLKDRGILLAICSKNNEDDAKEVFVNHPDMVMKLKDFQSIRINWNDKPRNIVEISKELNIGLDSCVFIDDNPAEREIVRHTLPEVAVPHISSDPSDYINNIERHRYFELMEFTQEDKKRSEYYEQKRAHDRLKNERATIEDYYNSLDMVAEISHFDLINLPRIVQLFNKTNQFNLTSRRYNENEIKKIMDENHWVTFYLKLKDKFGEHGLVGLMICFLEGKQIFIDTWLMSCRVMGRTVENTMLRYLYGWAKKNEHQIIYGKYIPTSKNKVVEDLYKKFGFKQCASKMDEGVKWYYDIQNNHIEENHFIRLSEK